MKTFLALVLSFLILFSSVTEAKHGVIGYGISMYKPSCCYACHDSLSTLYLSCTTFVSSDMDGMDGMDMKLAKRMDMGGDEPVATTNDTCYASNRPWLETFANCIRDKCDQDGISQIKQDKCFTTLAANGLVVPSLEDALPKQEPTVELSADGMWLNKTSLVNEETYHTTQRTYEEFSYQEERHARYSIVSMVFVIGICILAGIWNFIEPFSTNIVSKKLAQYLFVPALFGSRHLQPLPHAIGYAPRRGLSLFIAAYVALNIIFSAVDYHNVSPNVWYTNRRSEIATYIGNRTGVLSFANLALAILFSGRNSLLIAITGWSQTSLIAIHRWAARVATVQAVVHSVIYTLTKMWSGGAAAYYAEAARAYYWWGIIATAVLCIAMCFAALPFRIKYYEVFLVTHILFAILALIGCFYHISIRFQTNWGYEVWLYIAFAFWSADRVARFCRLVFFNRAGASEAVVTQIPGTNVLEVTVVPSAPWKAGPGQHSFFYIASLKGIWENHPFTIAAWGSREASRLSNRSVTSKEVSVQDVGVEASSDSDSNVESGNTNQITFLMRTRKGMTARLLNQVTSSNTTSIPLSVFTEGSYGGHRSTLLPLRSADTILCIAGGIGVTSAMGFLQQYVQDSTLGTSTKMLTGKTSRFVFAWSAREETLINHLRSSLLPPEDVHLAEGKELDYKFWWTGTQEAKMEQQIGLSRGRMNVGQVVRETAETGKKTVVLVCAPGGMSDEVRQAVVSCLAEGKQVELIEEAFAW